MSFGSLFRYRHDDRDRNALARPDWKRTYPANSHLWIPAMDVFSPSVAISFFPTSMSCHKSIEATHNKVNPYISWLLWSCFYLKSLLKWLKFVLWFYGFGRTWTPEATCKQIEPRTCLNSFLPFELTRRQKYLSTTYFSIFLSIRSGKKSKSKNKSEVTRNDMKVKNVTGVKYEGSARQKKTAT